ncbi:MAG: LysR family transcriptional regulator [Rhizomicrobium sp.]
MDGQMLADLWVFRSAARMGSFTAAARRIGVTQGAVSQRIARLEGRLGRALFSRAKGKIALTSEGSSFLTAMNQVSLLLDEPLSRVVRASRRSLVVSCIPSFATEWLVPNLESFYREHGDIELFVRAELVPMSAERMEDAGIDLAIVYEREPVSDLHELLAHRELTFPVCSAAYLEGLRARDGRQVVRLHDEEPWHGASAGEEWQGLLTSRRGDWAAAPSAERHFNMAHLAYHAAMCGQGIAVGRAIIVHRLLNKGDLMLAGEMEPVPSAHYRVVTHRPGDSRSAVRIFTAWLGKTLAATQAQAAALMAAGDRH